MIEPHQVTAEVDWPFGPAPAHSPAFAWLQLAVAALTPGGRGVVVMPAGLFRESRIAVALWMVAAPGDAGRRELLLMDAASKGRRREGTYRELAEATQKEIVRSWHDWVAAGPAALEGREGFAVAVMPEQIAARDGVVSARLYLPEVRGAATGMPDGDGAAPGEEEDRRDRLSGVTLGRQLQRWRDRSEQLTRDLARGWPEPDTRSGRAVADSLMLLDLVLAAPVDVTACAGPR